ncbi:helix-turn-helix transcriptional regulator [Lonepinella koalarum]|uniref:XRE family transcriptional regulator n=1 Tax=Lonepinella koalarum TaxID=53417 RepID=UPI0011E3FBD6|nr:S24 family peptidase [Lonepinella koalarum]TYG33331.1 helix-turn-helix transcriptional regulator [Lonepinella koalarum]
MSISERLSRLMQEQNRSIDDIKEVAGVTYEMARRYKIGTAEPRKEKLTKIAEYFGVTPSWLQFGIGSITDENYPVEQVDNSIVIDVLNIEASAGFGSSTDVVEIVQQLRYVPEQFYENYRGLNPTNIRVINVKGDSMLPTFSHGDLAFVDITITQFDGDGVYVFTYDDHLFLKRLQKAGTEILVISDNREQYTAWKVDPNIPVYIHGKVKVHQNQKLNFIG